MAAPFVKLSQKYSYDEIKVKIEIKAVVAKNLRPYNLLFS